MTLLFACLAGENDANGKAQKFIQRTHPLSITASQVVVHRDHVHPFTRQCIQVHRQRRHQRFTLTGFHFSDAATVQGHAAYHLHIEVTHAHNALTGFSYDRKGGR